MSRDFHMRKFSVAAWSGRFLGLAVFGVVLALVAMRFMPAAHAKNPPAPADKNPVTTPAADSLKPGAMARATFAGGCFWCMEPPFENVPGVTAAISGYSGGDEPAPTYEQVSAGRTGHAEVVDIAYDPSRISYATLLEIFWRSIDPTDAGGQFADRGGQYRPGIFPRNAEQKRLAEASKAKLAAG